MRKKKTPAPKLSHSVKRFIKTVGQFIEYWGFMRLQGEIWALVFISRQPLTASEVAKLLEVSKASVSLAMKQLVEYEVLLPENETNQRNLPLIANEDLNQVITGVLKIRETQLLSQAIASFESISSGQKNGLELDEARLARIGELMNQAKDILEAMITMNELSRSPSA